MTTTITYARAHLAELWDEIERTQMPLILHRKGHADMALLPATELYLLRDEVLTPFLALLSKDIDEHRDRLGGFPHALLAPAQTHRWDSHRPRRSDSRHAAGGVRRSVRPDARS